MKRIRTVLSSLGMSFGVVIVGLCSTAVTTADICENVDPGCKGKVTTPCEGSPQLCAEILGDNNYCTDGSNATFFYAVRPGAEWYDCTPNSSGGNCTRSSAVCTIMHYYLTEADCFEEDECGNDPIDACTYNGGPC